VAFASADDVRSRLSRTGYPIDKLVFIKGFIEETVSSVPVTRNLALLRFHIDQHRSISVALTTLYPRLVAGGVLIFDDYGHWQGQQEAVDAYFRSSTEPALLSRIDYGCRLGVKRSFPASDSKT
jgi:O-methyltransferase